MNNSQILPESEPGLGEERLALLRQREGELVNVIETILGVAGTDGWKVLKDTIFDKTVDSLEKRIQSAAKAKEVDLPELYRLQGQLTWAKKFASLEGLAQAFKVELENTRKILNG